MFFRVRSDPVWIKVRETGRFNMEHFVALSPEHTLVGFAKAQRLMVDGKAKVGCIFLGREWVVEGPLPHVEFSTNADPDVGPEDMPNPIRDPERYAVWDRAEKARIAKKFHVGAQSEVYVDFTLTTDFRKLAPSTLSTRLANADKTGELVLPLKHLAGGQLWTPPH